MSERESKRGREGERERERGRERVRGRGGELLCPEDSCSKCELA